MSEQAPQGGQSACPHPEAVGKRWGDPIGEGREAELKALADQQRVWAAAPDHKWWESSFQGVSLTGADVFWLAAYALAGPDGDMATARKQLHTMWEHGESLESFDLPALHLEGANLHAAHLEGANLLRARLQRGNLQQAHLEGAALFRPYLQLAFLYQAHVEGVVLYVAYLSGANLKEARLEGANLRYAILDGQTFLADVTLGEPRSTFARLLRRKSRWGNARLGDIRWEGPPDLTRVRWESLQRLGEEEGADWRTPARYHRPVVRAYRQVAAQLRAQGLSEEADHFAERGQIRKRKQTFRQMLEDWRRPWRFPFDLLRWLFSWLLALVSGYGYHPERALITYVILILGFAVTYFNLAPMEHVALNQLGALVLSMTSFHGRGFFPGSDSSGHPIPLHDPLTVVAAFEALAGLLMEITLFATVTQRFFGSK